MQILCVKSLALGGLGQGVLCGPALPRLEELLKGSVWLDRLLAESDESHKQLIPYAAFRLSSGAVFAYDRAAGGGEARLHRKWSIGVGGHLEFCDGPSPYQSGLLRELKEEVGYDPPADFDCSPLAFVNDDSDEVGRVHLGVFHLIDLPDGAQLLKNTREVSSGGFFPRRELLGRIDDFENWSKLLLLEDSLWG